MVLRRKRLKWTIILGTILFALHSPVAFASMSDIRGHWAENSINDLVDQEIISGYPDGTFRPDAEITRAEFTCLIIKAFEMESDSNIAFTDTAQHWAKQGISIAKANGIVSGYNDNYFGPEDPITREQMAVMMVKLINSQTNDLTVEFKDKDSISDWALAAVVNAVDNGILCGYQDNTFRPDKSLTRAEAVAVTSASLKLSRDSYSDVDEDINLRTYDVKGYYGPTSGTENVLGNVNIKADGVVLRNMIIDGDLTVAEEVGQGTVTLNNIVVKGDTFVRGGGPNSIYINGGQYNQIIIENIEGKVRIVATDVNGANITISENAQGEEIILEGDFDTVNINAPGVRITTKGNTTIQDLTIGENAEEIIINLSSDTAIKDMTIESKTEVRGAGIINTAHVNADGVVFQTKPDKWVVSSGVDEPIIMPQTSVGGGGGVSGGAAPVEKELAISPANCLFYKNAPNDLHINIVWGKSTRITKITGSALGGGVIINLQEGIHYFVTDNHDGMGTLIIKKEVTDLLPVPISAVPEGTTMTLTISFDQGEKTVAVTVARDPSIVNVSPSVVYLNKNRVNDMTANITWGAATRITGITGSALGGDFTTTLQEGIHYSVTNDGNGRGTLMIKKSLVDLFPVPITAIPDGMMLTLNVVFDQGEKELTVLLVNDKLPPSVTPAFYHMDKDNPTDMELNITWNDATQIDSITLLPFSNATPLSLEAGIHYIVNDNSDGTASLTILSNVFSLLPVPLSVLPNGIQMKTNLIFDYGETMFAIDVVDYSLDPPAPVYPFSPASVNLDKNDIKDILVEIHWAPIEITRITGRVAVETLNLNKNEHYTIQHSNGDGAGLLTLKVELFDLLSVPVTEMPNGTQIILTIELDPQEEFEFAINIGELSINPDSVELSKTNVTDIPINIGWGSATEISEIRGLLTIGGSVGFNLQKGIHYMVNDNGDGTGTLTVLNSFLDLIPVSIGLFPEGPIITLNIKFDQGEERDLIITITE